MPRRKLGFLLIALLVVFYPLIIRDSYLVYVMNRSLIHAMIAMGLVTQVGFAGQISLASSRALAFFNLLVASTASSSPAP
jgi:branched-chain amino acid transport system permease protein